jgi:cytochrome c
VVAWILSENEIITPATVLDAASLPRVKMPARDRFVPDDRRPGATFH